MYENSSVGSAARICAGAEPDRTPVQDAILGILTEQNTTHDLINALEARLESVLAHKVEPSDKPGPVGAIRTGRSALHGQLNDRLDACDGHNTRLRALLDRLTV